MASKAELSWILERHVSVDGEANQEYFGNELRTVQHCNKCQICFKKEVEMLGKPIIDFLTEEETSL